MRMEDGAGEQYTDTATAEASYLSLSLSLPLSLSFSNPEDDVYIEKSTCKAVIC